jgi:hypothetical protein
MAADGRARLHGAAQLAVAQLAQQDRQQGLRLSLNGK